MNKILQLLGEASTELGILGSCLRLVNYEHRASGFGTTSGVDTLLLARVPQELGERLHAKIELRIPGSMRFVAYAYDDAEQAAAVETVWRLGGHAALIAMDPTPERWAPDEDE